MASNLEQLNTEVSQLGPALDSLQTEVQTLIAQAGNVPQATLDNVNNALAEIQRIGQSVTAATSSGAATAGTPPPSATPPSTSTP